MARDPTGPGRQLALDLGSRPALGRDDFVVAEANSAAVAWLDRWPDWPAGVLAIAGAPGSGKSHLVHVWLAQAGARAVAGGTLWAEDLAALARPGAAIAIDDADRGVDEAALFHLINRVREAHGTLLLTGVEPPARWPVRLPDLASRLKALPVATLGAPDDDLLEALIVKLLADRQIRAPRETVAYLARRIERSADAARRAVAALDALALAEGRPPSLALARRVIEGQEGAPS
jgi:chromosomal replication initiation ATPase DnaA